MYRKGGTALAMRSSHRPRFSEWQHPDVRAFLKSDTARERVVASQAKALLVVSTTAPIVARLVGATAGVVSWLATAIDALGTVGALFAVFRLVLLALVSTNHGANTNASDARRAAAVSTTDLSPSQRVLIGERAGGSDVSSRSPSRGEHDTDDAVGGGTHFVDAAGGSPASVRRRFGATSKTRGWDSESSQNQNAQNMHQRLPNDGPLFVGITGSLPGLNRDADGDAMDGYDDMARDGYRRAESTHRETVPYGQTDRASRGGQNGAGAVGSAPRKSPHRLQTVSGNGSRNEFSPRLPDSEGDEVFERHLRHLGDAVDREFDLRENNGNATGGFGSSPGGSPGLQQTGGWGRKSPHSAGYGASPGTPFTNHNGTPGSVHSAHGGSPGGRYQFRPSPPPRARAEPSQYGNGRREPVGSPRGTLNGDGGLSTSDLFATLHAEGCEMGDVWADRLREWFAFRVLKPLVATLERSDADVTNALAALGEKNVRVRSLVANQEEHGNQFGGGSTQGGYASGAYEQDAMVLEQVRTRLEQMLGLAKASLAQTPAPGMGGAGGMFGGGGGGMFGGGGFGSGGGMFGGNNNSTYGSNNPQQQLHEKEVQVRLLTNACDACITHVRLIGLLRAESPRGLLPATPAGYVSSRICELAESSCVADFTHASGGDFGYEKWSTDLPNDAHLVCYLFCAFLETPGWVFSANGVATIEGSSRSAGAAAGGGSLYFARPPPPHVERFTAVLASRPPPVGGNGASKENGCAVVMPRGMADPRFSVYCGGDAPFVFDGPNGVWRSLCALALHARERNGGVLGTTRMGAANIALESIFQVPGRVL